MCPLSNHLSVHQPRPIIVGAHEISEASAPYIIAEAGVNHDGKVDQAKRLIDAAREAGAQAVKFQVFSANALVTGQAAAAPYQVAATGASSQRTMLKGLELSIREFSQLAQHCKDFDIAFLATPFSVEDLRIVLDIGVPAVKIASCELNNYPLLDAAIESRLPIMLSTGACALTEIEDAVRHLNEQNACERLVLFHCVSSYPTAPQDASLSTIAELRQRYGVWTGYSDHTESVEAGGLAVACGARVLEKHFTLDRNLKGPDHSFSLTADLLRQYIDQARAAWQMIGQPRRGVADVEKEVRESARKSVVARTSIRSGQTITAGMLTLKRPAGGIVPKDMHKLIGRTAREDISEDVQVVWDMVS